MKLKITVHGVAYEVDVEVLDAADEMRGSDGPLPAVPPSAAPAAAGAAPPPTGGAAAPGGSAARPAGLSPDSVASPIAGTVLEVKVAAGDRVAPGQALLVIEAMKMETAIAAPAAGTVRRVVVAAGDTVREGQVLVELEA